MPKKVRLKAKPKNSGPETVYSRALRAVAKHIGKLVGAYDPTDFSTIHELDDLLRRYSAALKPWSERVAKSMLADVNKRNHKMWSTLSGEIGTQLKYDIRETPVGVVMRQLMAEQVDLITTLPLNASKRVHRLVLMGLEDSARSNEMVAEIKRQGSISDMEARRIARTEVGRASTVLSQARAQQVGSTHYIWRTAGDGEVRKGHADMEGKVCEWANPPAVNENGRIMYHHPGCIWNCRCWPETIITTVHWRLA